MSTREGWFEIWWDYSSRPPYLLILSGGCKPDCFEIFDPQEKRRVHGTSTYQEAVLWLTEDEFTRVEGRTSLDQA